MRTAAEANTRNRINRSRMKTAMKKVAAAEDKPAAEAALRSAISVIDKNVKFKVIHRNKAANQKSRLTKMVQGIT